MDKEKKYFIHESTYVDDKVKIGKGTKIWHFSHIQSGSIIGDNCSIGQNVNIGNNVKIQNNVSIFDGVRLEDNVFCGPSCVFTNIINPRSLISRKGEIIATLVRQGATIGANATIICGHIIGKYSFIGAGSVITKDIPDYAIMVGNPSRNIGWMSEFGKRLVFNDKGIAICDKTGSCYKLNNNLVNKIDE